MYKLKQIFVIAFLSIILIVGLCITGRLTYITFAGGILFWLSLRFLGIYVLLCNFICIFFTYKIAKELVFRVKTFIKKDIQTVKRP